MPNSQIVETMTQYEVLTIFCGFLTAIVALVIGLFSRIPVADELNKERLEKLYSPLFRLAEPILFRPVSSFDYADYLDKFIALTNEHYSLCDPSLLESIGWLEGAGRDEEQRQERFFTFCERLCRQHDKIRKKLKLPTRNLFYRINKHQFSSKAKECIALIFVILRILFQTLLIAVGFILVLSAVISSLKLTLARFL